MGVEELKAEALRLEASARAYLVRELLASLEGIALDEIEAIWIDEAIRRDDELASGKAVLITADEVFARARERLR